MQLLDSDLRPLLEADMRAAWGVATIHSDAPRTEGSAAKLPQGRIALQDFASLPSGGGAGSRDAIVPHIYRLTGTFPYPASGTVNEEQVKRWNELVALLTADYPTYGGWRFSEEVGGEFDDDTTEHTYEVSVIFTILVVTPVRTQ